ncbi:MAG: septal ring lytic transglycosylase RlpA family protein [Burkholderiales bacterium]|nr:septal ring lytic transglycosylase RlpA family protein [Burkholderiales bacterium]
MARRLAVLLLALAATVAAAEEEDQDRSPEPLAAPAAVAQDLREVGRGLASWYGQRFHGRRTASGERFDMHELTAAHRTLPFGTVVRVQSLVNGRTVDVRINDRGPFLRKRVIDLSRAAAEALGLLEAGTGTKPVVLKVEPR